MQLFANNADSSLNGAIASDTVVLVLKAGEGAKFPSPTNGDFFLVTLFQRVGTTELNHEIVKCTSRAGDNLTVVRAQEGTSAKPFNSGDLVELRFTKGSADNMVQKVAGKGLSTEDYTTAEKSKLAGVEAGAQVNTVASVAGKTGAVSLAKADVGLGNVDNTSDVNKPVSTATQNALNGKEGTITPGTAAQYFRGDKSWRDFFTDVRAATLTGLSTATNAVVVASDTVLSAIGKLQAQVSSKFDKTGGTISGNTTVVGTVTAGQGQTVAFPPAAIDVKPTAHATSRRAAIVMGAWIIGQDSTGNGVQDLFFYDTLTGRQRLNITPSGNILSTSGAIGYGGGAGGIASQPGQNANNQARNLAVTLNKPSGQISTGNAALAAGSSVVFNLNNSFVTSLDTVDVSISNSIDFSAQCIATFSGVVVIRLTNISAASSSLVAYINFGVGKVADS